MGGLSFGTDGDGNCGYYGADGSLIPFKRVYRLPDLSYSDNSATWVVKNKDYTYDVSGYKHLLLTISFGLSYPNGSTCYCIVICDGKQLTSREYAVTNNIYSSVQTMDIELPQNCKSLTIRLQSNYCGSVSTYNGIVY